MAALVGLPYLDLAGADSLDGIVCFLQLSFKLFVFS